MKKCIISGKPLTKGQTKFYCMSVNNLFKVNGRDIEKTRHFLDKDFIFIPEIDEYVSNRWGKARAVLKRRGIPTQDMGAIYHRDFADTCRFPGCPVIPEWDFTNHCLEHFCCITHHNQNRRIRNGDYTVDELVYGNGLDHMKFLRVEDVACHLVTNYGYKPADLENYYNTHLRKDGDPDGKCLWCGKDSGFKTLAHGYNRFCYNGDCSVLWHNENENRHVIAGVGIAKSKAENPQNNPTRIEYWIKQGYTEEAAARKLTERQTTNSVEAIMKRNGCDRDEAISVRKEITVKWLESKPCLNYSMISQRLFWEIQNRMGFDVDDVFFATFDRGLLVEGTKNNKEFKVNTESAYRMLDFYVRSLNKAIEFDGEYWHNKHGARELDLQRERDVVEAIGCEVLRIDEAEFNESPDRVIQQCIDFLSRSSETTT